MKRPINYPLFPVTAYPGDDENPPVRSNSGLGVREYAAIMILQGLLANNDLPIDDAIRSSVSAADILIETLTNR